MRLSIAIFAIAFSAGLFAQGAEVKEGKAHEPGQTSESVLETEKVLDEKISFLNKELEKHTVLFRQKILALPAKTILYKGTADGSTCKEAANQTDPANNCLKIEVFDFQDSETGKAALGQGSRAKSMILFYDGPSTGTGDPMKEPPRKLSKVIFQTKNVDFKQNEIHLAKIEDNDPSAANAGAANDNGGAHDEKLTIIYTNGYPTLNVEIITQEETASNKGIGNYTLKSVENTKTNPIRNNFKRNFFIKNLDYFHKLYTNVADTNERYALKKYKDSNDFMKSSLKY
jgi:hypothetical protein